MCNQNATRARKMVESVLTKVGGQREKFIIEMQDLLFDAFGDDIKGLKNQMEARLTTVEKDLSQVKKDVSTIMSVQKDTNEKISIILEKLTNAEVAHNSSEAIPDKALGQVVKNIIKRKEFWFGVAFVLLLCIAAGFGMTAIFSNPDSTARIVSSVTK